MPWSSTRSKILCDLVQFYRRAIVRPKFRRKAAKGSEAPVVDPAPVRLSGGLASAHLIALILIAKYWDHLPLYRQARQYKRYGCELSQESMVRWVAKAGEWLDRIHERMKWELLQGNYIQVDETPIARLYCIEAHMREFNTPLSPSETKAYRQKHVALKWKWLGQLIRSQAPKSPMGKACTYAINHWEYLSHYLEYGEVQIDNNLT